MCYTTELKITLLKHGLPILLPTMGNIELAILLKILMPVACTIKFMGASCFCMH